MTTPKPPPTQGAVAARTFTVPGIDTVTYGEGAFDQLPRLVTHHGGTRVLVVLSSSLAGGPVEDALRAGLGDRLAGIHTKVPQHVPRSAVLAAAEAARDGGADCVVSIGGGTPIDCAKAVTLCLGAGITRSEQFDDFRVRFTYPDRYDVPTVDVDLIPHIAVPTTLSGGEHTALFGVTDEQTHLKGSYSNPRFIPRAVVLDPWVGSATPEWLWAASGLRAVDHAVEGMLSGRHMPMTDALGAGALDLLARNLARSAKDPHDAEARVNCLLGTWLSIFGLTNVGVGLSHGIGHQLAAEFDIIHGLTSAIMLPRVMDFVAPVIASRLRPVAEAMGVDTRHLDDGAAAAAASGAVRDLVAALGIASTIREAAPAAVSAEALPDIAERAMSDPAVAACPRPVDRDDVLGLLRDAW